MQIHLWLNDQELTKEIDADLVLLDFLRDNRCYSVKRGCDTANCGLCTVLMDNKLVLACSTLTARVDGKQVVTLEGLQPEALELAPFLADEGADQCGFCNPGLMMTIIGMTRELENPSDTDIRNYLAGNLCRCSGYASHLRGIKAYLAHFQTHGGIPR